MSTEKHDAVDKVTTHRRQLDLDQMTADSTAKNQQSGEKMDTTKASSGTQVTITEDQMLERNTDESSVTASGDTPAAANVAQQQEVPPALFLHLVDIMGYFLFALTGTAQEICAHGRRARDEAWVESRDRVFNVPASEIEARYGAPTHQNFRRFFSVNLRRVIQDVLDVDEHEVALLKELLERLG